MSQQTATNGVGTGNPSLLQTGAPIASASSTSANQLPASPISTTTPEPQSKRWRLLKNWCLSYFGGLAAVGVIIHLIASIATVALYFAPLPILFLYGTPWYAPFNGAFLSYFIIWPLAALFVRYSATAKGGNPRSYGLLRARYHQLIARLGPEEYDPFPTDEAIRIQLAKLVNPEPYQLVALQEAYRCMESVRDMLQEHSAGLMWSMGLGYITAWGMLHRAEEAMIEIEPAQLVIRGAMHDRWSIENSQIGNREELLDTIIQGITDIDKEAATYFKEHQPDANAKEVERLQLKLTHTKKIVTQLTQTLAKLNTSVIVVDDDEDATAPCAPDPNAEARGRSAIHEVRRTLNQYRDNLWEGLVRARNQLWSTAALTGLITHALLCITLLTTSTYNVHETRNNIVAATAFYITGAIAGLFVRFYRESTNNSAIDDYGLSTVRLITTPLLSGLAGIGGVLITSLLYSAILTGHIANSSDAPSIASIFQLSNPLLLIAAAIFGLTPNLIIKSLQEQTEKYAIDLQNSSTVRGAPLSSTSN